MQILAAFLILMFVAINIGLICSLIYRFLKFIVQLFKPRKNGKENRRRN